MRAWGLVAWLVLQTCEGAQPMSRLFGIFPGEAYLQDF